MTDRTLGILRSYYFDDLTLREVGEIHRVSYERVRNLSDQYKEDVKRRYVATGMLELVFDRLLDTNIRNFLYENNIYTVTDLIKETGMLGKIKSIGPKREAYIRRLLSILH